MLTTKAFLVNWLVLALVCVFMYAVGKFGATWWTPFLGFALGIASFLAWVMAAKEGTR